MDNWKILQTFTYPHEAHVVKGYLESEGIDSLIEDEFTTQVHNFYSNAIGGVKLLVHESNYKHGLEILKEGGFIEDPSNADIQEIELIDINSIPDKEACPFCKSKNIGKKKEPNILIVILYFLFGAFFPIFKKSYKCFECEKEWKYKKN